MLSGFYFFVEKKNYCRYDGRNFAGLDGGKEGKLHKIFRGKKFISFCVLFFMFFVFLVYSEAPPEKKFELKLSGGISRLSGTDYDASDRGWDYLRKASMENQGGTYVWEQNSLDWGWEIAGEILFNLSSRFALSGGVGYIAGKSTSKGTTALEGITTINEADLKAKAIPVTVGIYYFLPISSRSRVYLSAGVGYYFASFTRAYLREDNTPYWINADFTGSGGDVGFHGGIGFEYVMSKSIAIVIEGFGRYAKIRGFEGTRSRGDSNDWSDSVDGNYYYSERFVWTDEWVSRTNIGTSPPSGDDVRNVRDAEIDFSGFTIRFGLKIKLF